jgi:chaperonin GroEL
MPKHYESGRNLQERILEGVNILADNVASTLGPRGRNVVLYKAGALNPIVTKDGATVAKFVDLEDPVQNVGAQLVKQAASQTNINAGDGTTTATVLTREILLKAQRHLIAGASPIELKRGMDKAVTVVVEYIRESAVPVSSEEDVRHIATISANGDTSVGDLVTMAVDQAGKDGAITIEEARSIETSLDVVEGFRFDSGYFARAFITDERREIVKYDSPLMLVTDYKIDAVEEIYPILELVARDTRPLIIISEEVQGQALAALVMNAQRGTLKVAAVKAPRYGEERREILKDLCVATGATFVSRDTGLSLKDVKLSHLGSCKTIEIEKNFTTIVDGKGDNEQIEDRINSIKSHISETEDLYRCEKFQERISRLASGIAIIRVGAPTEVEMIEKKHRIEDALEAVKSAQAEGMIPGGGRALLTASKLEVETDNEEQATGAKIVMDSLSAPMRQMSLNAGESPDIILNKVMESEENIGYNFATGELADMFESGIIDPAKVTRVALQNAVSVSSILITTNHSIIEI